MVYLPAFLKKSAAGRSLHVVAYLLGRKVEKHLALLFATTRIRLSLGATSITLCIPSSFQRWEHVPHCHALCERGEKGSTLPNCVVVHHQIVS